jgi:hypothetical protein
MIRVTVKEIYELQKSIQSTGEVHAIVGPKEAFSTDRFFVAWARSVHGEDFYLAVYRDGDSWRKASNSDKQLPNTSDYGRAIIDQAIENVKNGWTPEAENDDDDDDDDYYDDDEEDDEDDWNDSVRDDYDDEYDQEEETDIPSVSDTAGVSSARGDVS